MKNIKRARRKIVEFLNEFEFNIKFIKAVSIYDEKSIEDLKTLYLQYQIAQKMKRTFFRFYVDRVFSVKGSGTVVTGTVLGKKLSLKRRFYSSFAKRDKKKIFKFIIKTQ